jgi:hypothetical protein
MTNIMVGRPLGLDVSTRIAPSSVYTFSGRAETYMRVSRVRWFGGSEKLELLDVRVGRLSLVRGLRAGISLAGSGVWRFPAETVQVSQDVSVSVQNNGASAGALAALSFWGVDDAAAYPPAFNRGLAQGFVGVPPSAVQRMVDLRGSCPKCGQHAGPGRAHGCTYFGIAQADDGSCACPCHLPISGT